LRNKRQNKEKSQEEKSEWKKIYKEGVKAKERPTTGTEGKM
jgi:hypothetical protein